MARITKWLGQVLHPGGPTLQAHATEDEIRRLEEEQGTRAPERTDAVGKPLERDRPASPPGP